MGDCGQRAAGGWQEGGRRWLAPAGCVLTEAKQMCPGQQPHHLENRLGQRLAATEPYGRCFRSLRPSALGGLRLELGLPLLKAAWFSRGRGVTTDPAIKIR